MVSETVALKIVKRLWADNEGEYVGLATKSGTGEFHRHLFIKGEWKKIMDLINECEERRVNVYANVNCFSKPRATNNTAVWGPWLYSDLDGVNPYKIELTPTILIESSPKRYVGLWRLEDGNATAAMNRRLAHKLTKDKTGWEGAKVLRLIMGVGNYKYNPSATVVEFPR